MTTIPRSRARRFGGGNNVTNNLIYNTCKESGDHGPINSWDRQAYATALGPHGTTTLDPLPTLIASNFIFANYGAAQAVDNDDGSSFYTIEDNVFYDADGFKMDYGKNLDVRRNQETSLPAENLLERVVVLMGWLLRPPPSKGGRRSTPPAPSRCSTAGCSLHFC